MAQDNKIKISMEPTDIKHIICESDVVEPWEKMTPDQAVADVVNKNVKPGFEGHMCNPKHRDKTGWEGWKVDGTSPRVGDLVLGTMPKEKADKRTFFFRKESLTKQKIRNDQTAEAIDRVKFLQKGSTIMSYSK